MGAALGKGFTAAGNSAGKSKFQALASGAGAGLEGATAEQHQNTKDAQSYMAQALAAQKAGDDAGYKTNRIKADLAIARMKVDADKVTPNKNDSPTQLYLAAQRNVAADPLVKGAYSALQQAQKSGNGPNDPAVLKAQQAYQQTVQERQAAHLAGVGLHPQTADQIAKQPGMSEANPIDAKAQGITKDNIDQKLQPGQIYRNPANPSQLLRYKGPPASKVTPSAPSKPEPANPTKKMASTADDEDD